MSEPARYDATNIKVLKGLDAVRKRPGMYIGDRRRHQWNDSYQENICCFTNNLSAQLRKSG